MSAGTVGALARNRSLDPGEDMQERRGRLRERSDMAPIVGRRDDPSNPAPARAPGPTRHRPGRPVQHGTGPGGRWAGTALGPGAVQSATSPAASSRAIWSARSPGVSCSDSRRSNRALSPAVNARHSGNPST